MRAQGIYGYPAESAALVALQTVRSWLDRHGDKVCLALTPLSLRRMAVMLILARATPG